MNRLTRFAASIAALAALALGGSALAAASQTSHSSSPPPATTAQSGDQSTGGNPAEAPGNPVEGQPNTADTDNLQQGDQSSSDTAGETEQTAPEAAASDGPGGYADTNPNADTQQTGEH